MLVIEWSIAKLDIHVQVYISDNLPSLFFKMSMIEGIDLTQICSIFYRRSRTCQTSKRVRRKMMKGDFTDEFLEDEDVEEDDNDNEE